MLNQIQIQKQLKLVDDVFHPLIIALERYESCLERKRTGKDSSLSQVAMHTEGDLSNYSPETMSNESFLHRQLRVECITLHNQTVFEEDSIAKISNRYFLEDLLEWYGGREDSISYNEIDAFGYPIICAICQVVPTPGDIKTIIETYIKELPKIEPTHKDIENALSRYLKAEHEVHERYNNRNAQTNDYIVRHHKRGSLKDGYERLFLSFIYLFNDDVPAKTLCRVVKDFLPELFDECASINEDMVDILIMQKETKRGEIGKESSLDNESSDGDTLNDNTPSHDNWLKKAHELYEILKKMFENN